ncbi:MAG: hypothetical protein P1P86_06795 [Bacteroidales bacterium]|nr:hypothetical protein [Bacteroidales bacterium]
MRLAIKPVYMAMGFFLLSCGGEGEHPLKEEYYYLEEAHKEWLAPDTIGEVFIMRDYNGISSSMSMTGNNETMGKSWSTFLGINTRTCYTEECFQSFKSGFGMLLGISMRANSPPHGDQISISLGQVGFSYDFDFETISSLDTPFGYKNLLMTDKGYEIHEDGEIMSSVEFLDSLLTSYGTYQEVLHFIFNDFNPYWTDFTVREIYLAKEVGLVKYVLASGVSNERFHPQN